MINKPDMNVTWEDAQKLLAPLTKPQLLWVVKHLCDTTYGGLRAAVKAERALRIHEAEAAYLARKADYEAASARASAQPIAGNLSALLKAIDAQDRAFDAYMIALNKGGP